MTSAVTPPSAARAAATASGGPSPAVGSFLMPANSVEMGRLDVTRAASPLDAFAPDDSQDEVGHP